MFKIKLNKRPRDYFKYLCFSMKRNVSKVKQAIVFEEKTEIAFLANFGKKFKQKEN